MWCCEWQNVKVAQFLVLKYRVLPVLFLRKLRSKQRGYKIMANKNKRSFLSPIYNLCESERQQICFSQLLLKLCIG